ncbi:MAG: glycerate kinase, partial [Spirosomataceae bacterium]
MKTLICPDKFKGSLTAIEVARAVKEGLPNHFRTTLIPMADGGEGSLEVVAD